MTEQLKACPFPGCGRQPIHGFMGNEDGGYGFVECPNQGGCDEDGDGGHFCGVHADSEEAAIRIWNTRPSPEADALRKENERLTKLLNTPEVDDFAKGAVFEAAHQRERWGADHDVGKTPFDWFWLIGYLAQKAAHAATAGDEKKAKHHTISTAAALANWHLALSGADSRMVPGAPLSTMRQADAALANTPAAQEGE